jgi:hypothetical protein
MLKGMGKVAQTDCSDSCKLSKSRLALETRNVQVKLRLRVKGPDFGNYYTDRD